MNKRLNISGEEKKSSCDKLTRTEFILALALIGVTLHVLYVKLIADDADEDIDLSPYESLLEIEKYTDSSIDPCEDFHTFACGGFFEIASRKQINNRIIEEYTELGNELYGMIVEPISAKDPLPINIQKMFFKACMDVEEIDANRNRRIVNLIDQIGGWPLMKGSEWEIENFDWVTIMLECKKLGLPFDWFLKFDLHVEDGVNYLKVTFPSASTYVKDDFMEKILYGFLMKRTDIRQLRRFDEKLTKAIKRQNSELTLISIGELQEKHPRFNWLEFLNSLTKDIYEFTEETQIATNVDYYIVELHQLLTGTYNDTQMDYIIWKIVESFAPYMSHHVRKHTNSGNRLAFCEKKTRESFPYFTEVGYIRKYVTDDVRKSANELVHSIRDEFLKRIEESNWFINSTSGETFLEKFYNTEIDIGLNLGDDDFVDANYLHLDYFNLDSNNANIVDLILARSKSYYDSIFRKINETAVKKEDKESLLSSLKMDNFFDESLNKIVVPSTVLHGFLFDHRRPQYLNFASLGTVLANEFIKTLKIFTSDKNAVSMAFEATDQCLEDDYSEISKETNTNNSIVSEAILPEIIAHDIAYTAYQNWVLRNDNETKLPLSSFNPNQLFWIKSSLINCHKILFYVKNAKIFNLIKFKYKNLLSVKHSRYFADDFGCLNNTSINPPNKC